MLSPKNYSPKVFFEEVKPQFADRTSRPNQGIVEIKSLADGKKGVLIQLSNFSVPCNDYCNNVYIIYDPAKDDWISVEETESRGLPSLWFRELYPNPATHGTVTANIMCYVSDISTVYLGLYDFMGKKVLDLSNSFEYEHATATIHTTFNIPKSLAKGSYFLVVRSGKETRTKGIIVQ